ncbi:MAG: hypothetical protein KI793_23595 [Rivularia sp. (in: Bacteria)]|nr:hypothetical protein [Rivularia sp. MS3]
MLVELAVGVILAGLTILVGEALPFTLPFKNYRKFYATALIIAALVYVYFSSLSQNGTWILTEIIGVIIFSIIALLGVKYSFWFLAIGWFIHPIWDLLIDNHSLTIFVPRWYPIICIGYDIVIGSYIAFKCIVEQKNSLFID